MAAGAVPAMEGALVMGEKYRDDRRGLLIGGLITLGIGVVFMLVNLDVIPNIGKMWPIFPIIVGIALIISSVLRSGGGRDAS